MITAQHKQHEYSIFKSLSDNKVSVVLRPHYLYAKTLLHVCMYHYSILKSLSPPNQAALPAHHKYSIFKKILSPALWLTWRSHCIRNSLSRQHFCGDENLPCKSNVVAISRTITAATRRTELPTRLCEILSLHVITTIMVFNILFKRLFVFNEQQAMTRATFTRQCNFRFINFFCILLTEGYDQRLTVIWYLKLFINNFLRLPNSQPWPETTITLQWDFKRLINEV